MLCKKAVHNGFSLELYTPFDFQLTTSSVPLPFFSSNLSNVG